MLKLLALIPEKILNLCSVKGVESISVLLCLLGYSKLHYVEKGML
jgi:hypothetical protein